MLSWCTPLSLRQVAQWSAQIIVHLVVGPVRCSNVRPYVATLLIVQSSTTYHDVLLRNAEIRIFTGRTQQLHTLLPVLDLLGTVDALSFSLHLDLVALARCDEFR